MKSSNIYPKERFLTVIIRDDSPLINCGDTPTYRSVTVELTLDQRDKIRVRSRSGQPDEYISQCFLEEWD